MNNGCSCNDCKCGDNSGTLDFITQSWDIPELMKASCHCVECEQECDNCECGECSCSEEVEHLGAGA